MLERIKVVLGAAVTWLVVVSAVVTILADEIASVLPSGPAQDVGRWALVVLAVIGAAVNIIRRVTPVLPPQRGLLPPD